MSIKGTKPGKQSQGTLNRQARRIPISPGNELSMAAETIIDDERDLSKPPNIKKMKKAELIEYAVSLGVPATIKMTVKQIKAALGE